MATYSPIIRAEDGVDSISHTIASGFSEAECLHGDLSRVPSCYEHVEEAKRTVCKTYGYAIGDSASINWQTAKLAEQGVDPENVLSDTPIAAIGSERKGYQKLVSTLDEGDILFVCSLNHLGKDYEEVRSEWDRIVNGIRANIVVLDMPLLDSRKDVSDYSDLSVSDMLLQILDYVAETKKRDAKQRQAEGIASAKAQGVKLGRPKKKRPRIYHEIKTAYHSGRITRTTAAKKLKVSPRTFDNWLKDDQATEESKN